jgi:hypothetical protein
MILEAMFILGIGHKIYNSKDMPPIGIVTAFVVEINLDNLYKASCAK